VSFLDEAVSVYIVQRENSHRPTVVLKDKTWNDCHLYETTTRQGSSLKIMISDVTLESIAYVPAMM
jgi:hypothetical protein